MHLLLPATYLAASHSLSSTWFTRRRLSQCRNFAPNIAASIIVAFDNAFYDKLSKLLPLTRYRLQKSRQDYHVLLLQRPNKSSFSNKFVFPGGAISREDFSSANWAEVFDYLTYPVNSFQSSITAPMYVTLQRHFCDTAEHSSLQSHIGLRLCALRELFEETGLLLVADSTTDHTSAGGIVLSPAETAIWQNRLCVDPAAFPMLYKSIGRRPPLISLKEWSNWMPPDGFLPQFDTMFFFVHLNSFESFTIANVSTLKLANEASGLYADEPLSFLPISRRLFALPQAYELGRLSQFLQLDKLTAFATQRATLGCRRWKAITSTVNIVGTECVIFFLPGDQRYMDVPGILSSRTFCAGELAQDTHRNRLVISPDCSVLWFDVNIYDLGHVSPILRHEYTSLGGVT